MAVILWTAHDCQTEAPKDSDVVWPVNTASVVKKAQPHLYFLWLTLRLYLSLLLSF